MQGAALRIMQDAVPRKGLFACASYFDDIAREWLESVCGGVVRPFSRTEGDKAVEGEKALCNQGRVFLVEEGAAFATAGAAARAGGCVHNCLVLACVVSWC